MIDHRFFASKLGIAALVSVAMMVAFNVFALSIQVASSAPAAGSAMGLPMLVLA